jgi:CheY-like chemotaxis protein
MKHIIKQLEVFKEIDFAENGLEALEMSQNKYYNLIVMDLNMPLMSGYEAVPLIKIFHKN